MILNPLKAQHAWNVILKRFNLQGFSKMNSKRFAILIRVAQRESFPRFILALQKLTDRSRRRGEV